MKTMKNTGLTLLTAIAFMAAVATNAVKAQPGMSVSFQLFYDELAPHGEWINDPEYGYIWLPYAEQGFQPYATNGYWVMTSYGNTWVSNYDWGWAPFHYGRWTYSDHYGWAWVPGYEWGPAWVGWRSGGGYYGWAPLGPSMSINVHVGIPHHHWVFVPQRYIASPRLYSYYAPYRNRVRIYNHTTIINNTYVYNNRTYVSGPRRSEVERATGSRVAVRDISRASRPGKATVNNRSVSLYRPEVDRNSRTSARPSRVADATAVRTANRATNGRVTTPAAANNRATTTATRGTSTRSTDSRTVQPANGRSNTEATRATGTRETGTRETTRTHSNDRSRESATPATRTRVTTPETKAVRSTDNTPRATGNTSRSTTNRAATPARQNQSTSSAQRATKPTVSQSNRSSTTVQRATPARNTSPKASTQRASSPSRSTTVKSQSSSSRPKASTSRSTQKSSSATRDRAAERKSS